MFFEFLNDIKKTKNEHNELSLIAERLEDILNNVNEHFTKKENEDIAIKERGELYYVYSYAPPNVYITKQKSDKIESLKGVSKEFIRNLAEGFVLRKKDGEYFIDEELTEKSMNFELDFDNYKE